MITKYASEFFTYISIFLASCVVFSLFIISANNSAHSEQTYQITDHQIHSHSSINNNNENKEPNNSEQDEQRALAFIH